MIVGSIRTCIPTKINKKSWVENAESNRSDPREADR